MVELCSAKIGLSSYLTRRASTPRWTEQKTGRPRIGSSFTFMYNWSCKFEFFKTQSAPPFADIDFQCLLSLWHVLRKQYFCQEMCKFTFCHFTLGWVSYKSNLATVFHNFPASTTQLSRFLSHSNSVFLSLSVNSHFGSAVEGMYIHTYEHSRRTYRLTYVHTKIRSMYLHIYIYTYIHTRSVLNVWE
jgi:hypothetical protein